MRCPFTHWPSLVSPELLVVLLVCVFMCFRHCLSACVCFVGGGGGGYNVCVCSVWHELWLSGFLTQLTKPYITSFFFLFFSFFFFLGGGLRTRLKMLKLKDQLCFCFIFFSLKKNKINWTYFDSPPPPLAAIRYTKIIIMCNCRHSSAIFTSASSRGTLYLPASVLSTVLQHLSLTQSAALLLQGCVHILRVKVITEYSRLKMIQSFWISW